MRSSSNCRSARCETPYYSRPQGSASKLSTWRDGYRILRTVLRLYRAERPLPLFTGIGISLAIVAIGIAIPIFMTYLEDGTVPRLPTAMLSTGLMLLAFLADRLRSDSRHGDARPARVQAPGLSGAARAGRRAAAELTASCTNWSGPTMRC